MTVLICIDGIGPGVGKSTVTAGLARILVDRGMVVDVFAEQDILTHPAWSRVAIEYREGDQVNAETLLQCLRTYLDGLIDRSPDMVVADALLPFVASLLGWGHDEAAISTFVERLAAELNRPGLNASVVYLDGHVSRALARAIAREQPGWLAWLIGTLGRAHPEPVIDRAGLIRHLEYRRDLTLRTLRQAGLNPAVVRTDDTPLEDVIDTVITGLRSN